MLPLLDVFMVVLFAMATTERGELAADDGGAEAARALAEAEAAADDAAAQRDEAAREAAEARASQSSLAAALAELRDEAAVLDEAHADAPRRHEVLERLLDQFNVFESEIAGESVGDGIRNRCCFRADLDGPWARCGDVPVDSVDREHYLDDGADGLVEALRKTKGGNAMTLIRQDEQATYRIAGALDDALRDRLAGHRIYNEGVSLATPLCPVSPRP